MKQTLRSAKLFGALGLLLSAPLATAGEDGKLPRACERLIDGLGVAYTCSSLERDGFYAVFGIGGGGRRMLPGPGWQGFFLLLKGRECRELAQFTVTKNLTQPNTGTEKGKPMMLRLRGDRLDAYSVTMKAGGRAILRSLEDSSTERMRCEGEE